MHILLDVLSKLAHYKPNPVECVCMCAKEIHRHRIALTSLPTWNCADCRFVFWYPHVLPISLIADRRKCRAQRMMGRPRVTTAPRDWLMFTLGRPIILCMRYFRRSAIRLCPGSNIQWLPSIKIWGEGAKSENACEATKSWYFCHFCAKIIKFGLILTHLSLFGGKWGKGGKKIFYGGNVPMPLYYGAASANIIAFSSF